jgi:outer membrane protein TolC
LVSEAWGGLYPSIDVSMSYTRNVSPAVNFVPATFFDPEASPDEQIAVQFGADNAWDGLVNVEQALFRPAVFLGVGAANRFESLQEEIVRGQVHSVVTDARVAFLDLLLAQEQWRLTENSVQRVGETLKETRAMNDAGLSSDYDVLRLEVELANLEPNLLRAENAVRQAKRRLAVLMDRDVSEDLTVAGELASMNLDDLSDNSEENLSVLRFSGRDAPLSTEGGAVQELVGTAVASRSDIQQADLTESLRHTEMRVEQMDYLPEVSLFGTYQVNASQNGEPRFFGSPRAYARRVGVQVTLPVFNGFQRESRIDQRRAALRAAQSQASLVRDEAEIEVRDVIDQVHEARARASAQSRAVVQAQRGFEIASAQYREGIGSQLEMTDAELALRESEFNYAQAVYDYLSARARLDHATGSVPLAGRVAR